MTKGKWASPRRWHDWRVTGPTFPVELIVTRPYPRTPIFGPDGLNYDPDTDDTETEDTTQETPR